MSTFLGMPWLNDYHDRTSDDERYYETSRDWDDDTGHELTRDVAFNRHSYQDGKHISPSDNATIQVGTDGIKVRMVQGLNVQDLQRTLSLSIRATNGAEAEAPLPGDWFPCDDYQTEYALWKGSQFSGSFSEWMNLKGRLCERHDKHEERDFLWYGHFGPPDDWTEMLKGGLQTALESQVVVFEISGVSRTCTHQLVRSRRAAFHQQSQRATFYGYFPELRMPESVWRVLPARRAFLDAANHAANAYRVACENNISYQDARFGMLEATTNYIVCEYPLREFLNVYAYRACSMFQWEIAHVTREMGAILVNSYPWLAPYIKISCQTSEPCKPCDGTGEMVEVKGVTKVRVPFPCPNCGGLGKQGNKCTFQGWENVEGQCHLPWAREDNRTFRSEHHRIERGK